MKTVRADSSLRSLGTSLRYTVASVVLCGVLYPLAVTGATTLLFPQRAAGSYVAVGGRVVGSALVGQRFVAPRYFHGRPSAAGKDGYDPTATGGTNLGPGSKKLLDATRAEIARLRRENPEAPFAPPADLVSSSASGIDPDVSPAAAEYQAPRVARARGLPLARVRELVRAAVRPRPLGILGEPRINVLDLNLALDRATTR